MTDAKTHEVQNIELQSALSSRSNGLAFFRLVTTAALAGASLSWLQRLALDNNDDQTPPLQ